MDQLIIVFLIQFLPAIFYLIFDLHRSEIFHNQDLLDITYLAYLYHLHMVLLFLILFFTPSRVVKRTE